MTQAPATTFSTAMRAAALAHRAALARREAASAAIMLRSYRGIAARLDARTAVLLEAIAELDATGGITRGELAKALGQMNVRQIRTESYGEALARVLTRHRELLAQTEAGINLFAGMVEQRVTAEQRVAVNLAAAHARELMGIAAPGVEGAFNRLPAQALEELVGVLRDGSPLARLLATFGPQAAQRAGQALVDGVGLGLSPRLIAGDVRKALGTTAYRALLVSRTEVLRSYRNASLATYNQNADIVSGWQWHSANSDRTCAFCKGQHGKVFKLDVPFESHPACRCAALPKTKSYAEILAS